MNSFRSFSEIEEFVTGSGIRKTIALAGAHDSYALDSVIHARKKGLIEKIRRTYRTVIKETSDCCYVDISQKIS